MSERGSSGCLKFFLIGCAVCVLLAVGIAVGGYYLVKTKGPEVAAYVVTGATDTLLAESGLSETEKQGIRKEIDRVTQELKAGEIAVADIQRFAEGMDESPFVALIVLAGFEHGALRPSGLTAEEKEEGEMTLQRLQRGLVEESVTPTELRSVADRFSTLEEKSGASGQSELSDEDVRTILTDLKAKVDEAQISDATYTVDYVDETRKAVDLLLGEETSGNVEAAAP